MEEEGPRVKIPSRCKKLLVERIQHRSLALQPVIPLVFAAAIATVTFGSLVIDLLHSTTPPPRRAAVAAQFFTLHKRVWPSLLVVLRLYSFHSLFVSHRFAGPFLRFRRPFEKVGDGDLTLRVNLCRHD